MEEAVQDVSEETKVEDVLNTPEVNQAAKEFSNVIPRIKGLSKNMSRNSLARVYSAVMEFPLAHKYPTFKKGTKEQELFMISLHALGAKAIMQNAIMHNQELQEQIYNEVVDGIVEEIQEKQDGE